MAQFDAEERSPKVPSMNSSQSTASSCATPKSFRPFGGGDENDQGNRPSVEASPSGYFDNDGAFDGSLQGSNAATDDEVEAAVASGLPAAGMGAQGHAPNGGEEANEAAAAVEEEEEEEAEEAAAAAAAAVRAALPAAGFPLSGRPLPANKWWL